MAIGDRLLTVDPDPSPPSWRRIRGSRPRASGASCRWRWPSRSPSGGRRERADGRAYLLDENGRPFKRADFEEADGLPVITGVTREQYAALRGARGGVSRGAGVARRYAEGAGRPKLSEIHVDPRAGFSLVLLDGAGEVRLGRGGAEEKLARLDRILARPARAGLRACRWSTWTARRPIG